MSAMKKVPPITPLVQEIPLTDLTITWERPRIEFEDEDKKVTLTGAQLGPMLKWMSYARHVALVDPGSLFEARLYLAGIADITLALSQIHLPGVPIDPERIFHLLSRVTSDAMAMLDAAETNDVPGVTIAIGRPAAADADKKVA